MKEYLTAIAGLAIACVFGVMWWQEKTKDRPVLPPSFIEQQIKQTQFVPLTEQISKVYAVCPKETLIADYLMSWTARVNYAIDVSKIKIEKKLTATGETNWLISTPEIKLLNEGNNLIDENDYYKFNNKFLVLMSEDDQEEHYKNEKARAVEIARYIAQHRIKEDENLKRIVSDQIRLVALGLISQVHDREPDYNQLEIEIAASTVEFEAPITPPLCENQPFKTNLGLSGLASEE